MNAQLIVEPADALADVPLTVRIEGLSAGEHINLRAETDNLFCINDNPCHSYGLPRWTSEAVFAANSDGVVDLDQNTPLQGDWNTACGSAPLYALRPQRANLRAEPQVPHVLSDVPIPGTYTVRLTASRADSSCFSATCVRRFATADTTTCDIAGEGFVARYFSPAQDGPLPAVIVLSGSDGRIEKAQIIASLFASHGLRALAVCYFGLAGTSRFLDRIPLEIVERACVWLRNRSEVDAHRISVFGRSKGGEMALAAASLMPGIARVVANAPSPFCYEGLRGMLPSRHTSWTWQGRELPFAKIPLSVLIRTPLMRIAHPDGFTAWLYERTLAHIDPDKVRFPLEHMQGPVFITTSAHDEVWPSRQHSELALHILDEAAFPHRYEHRCYEGGCHTMTVPFQPAPSLPADTDVDAWAAATDAAWRDTVAFLQE